MKKFDFIIIVVFVLIALGSAVWLIKVSNSKYDNKIARISINGKLYKEVELNEKKDDRFSVKTDLGMNEIQISDGSIRIIDADCPDKICVKDGSISKPGEILVCLPNKLSVEIIGQRQSDADEVAY
jgi:hypothetical protein